MSNRGGAGALCSIQNGGKLPAAGWLLGDTGIGSAFPSARVVNLRAYRACTVYSARLRTAQQASTSGNRGRPAYTSIIFSANRADITLLLLSTRPLPPLTARRLESFSLPFGSLPLSCWVR